MHHVYKKIKIKIQRNDGSIVNEDLDLKSTKKIKIKNIKKMKNQTHRLHDLCVCVCM